MMEFLQRFGVSIAMFIVSTVASFIFGRWRGTLRARREWEQKHFLDRINISMNVFSEGRLKIRTMFERSLEEIFQNKIAAEKVRAASKKTTAANALLPIDKEDCWYLLNFVLNSVAEHFSEGVVKEDAGIPIKKIPYAIFLTCEVVGEDRIRKVRAMMIKKEHLADFPYKEQLPLLENPWHETRVQTLRKAADVFQTHPENFLTIEICV